VVDVNGVQAVGSTAQAEVDKATGTYTGTSRSYVLGLQGASGFDSASSFMQVTNTPDHDATITYRMSYFNSDDLNKTGNNGISFGGQGHSTAAVRLARSTTEPVPFRGAGFVVVGYSPGEPKRNI
jgi:hypothetical protein